MPPTSKQPTNLDLVVSCGEETSKLSRRHITVIPASAHEQLRHNILSLLRSTFMVDQESFRPTEVNGLKKIPPYWYPYTTMTKQRWIGRELLEVVSTEFRDRSVEYYRFALESGVTTVNGKLAYPDTILKDGDRIENVVHRHEPPVTSTPVKVLLHDAERQFLVVDKPGSIPVHASGRYFRNSLTEILVDDFGYDKIYPANRLDRLTSGLMILPLTSDRARRLTDEFMAGTVRKEYVARVKGHFPLEEIICEQPMLTVDRQMGLNIVHPDGKPAKTVFNLIRYDANTDTSVVRCRPFTGRSHQIRVHLQFLGHSVANDPVYSEQKIWGTKLGQGGLDVTPNNEREAPAPPSHLQELVQDQGNPELLENPVTVGSVPKRLPRETGEDIGMGSPVPLSQEAVQVITNLRNMKDGDEDWSRWRDVVFRAKGKLRPSHVVIKPPPAQNRRKRGGKAEVVLITPEVTTNTLEVNLATPEGDANGTPRIAADPDTTLPGTSVHQNPLVPENKSFQPPQISLAEALAEAANKEPAFDTSEGSNAGHLYCPECYLPLHPDPKPERLYIFLHALKYTTSLGEFSTDMPHWAAEGWSWT